MLGNEKFFRCLESPKVATEDLPSIYCDMDEASATL